MIALYFLKIYIYGKQIKIKCIKSVSRGAYYCLLYFLRYSLWGSKYDKVIFGMFIAGWLTWGDHVDHVCDQVSSVVTALRYLAQFCESGMMITTYFCLLYPQLEFRNWTTERRAGSILESTDWHCLASTCMEWCSTLGRVVAWFVVNCSPTLHYRDGEPDKPTTQTGAVRPRAQPGWCQTNKRTSCWNYYWKHR